MDFDLATGRSMKIQGCGPHPAKALHLGVSQDYTGLLTRHKIHDTNGLNSQYMLEHVLIFTYFLIFGFADRHRGRDCFKKHQITGSPNHLDSIREVETSGSTRESSSWIHLGRKRNFFSVHVPCLHELVSIVTSPKVSSLHKRHPEGSQALHCGVNSQPRCTVDDFPTAVEHRLEPPQTGAVRVVEFTRDCM